MTQTLEIHERIVPSDRSAVPEAPTASAAASKGISRFGTFAITFGIAFAILYTFLEQMNWPLFT